MLNLSSDICQPLRTVRYTLATKSTVAETGNKSATKSTVADTFNFVADTVDFVTDVYVAKATRSTFNKVDRVELNFVASV